MPLTQGLTTQFKVNCLSGLENFTTGGEVVINGVATPLVYKIALYTAAATLDSTTTAYTTVDEVTGGGYTAGGNTLTVIPPNYSNADNTAYVSFQNTTWSPATFTCRGALIYNATTGASVCVLDFGADKTATGTFTITFPTADASNAIIRLS